MAGTSSEKPSLARNGTSTTRAPCKRPYQRNISNDGGQKIALSRLDSQKARYRQSMPSLLPRVTETSSGRTP